MGVYVFNKGKAQIIYGSKAIQPECYAVFSAEDAGRLIPAGFSVAIEGNTDFVPLWVTHIPESTPNQIA